MINLPYQLSQRSLKDIFVEFPTEVRLRHLRKIQEKKIWAKNLHLKLFNGKISAKNYFFLHFSSGKKGRKKLKLPEFSAGKTEILFETLLSRAIYIYI